LKGLKEAVKVTDQVQLEQKETEDLRNGGQAVERHEKTKEVSRERIERLKKAFRPSWLQDIIDAPENGNGKKKGSNNT
jgi:hypothetical protein